MVIAISESITDAVLMPKYAMVIDCVWSVFCGDRGYEDLAELSKLAALPQLDYALIIFS